jgi:hypothetical protein
MFSSLAQQNPSALLPYMLSGTVVKPTVEKAAAQQAHFSVSASSAFSVKLAPTPLVAASVDDVSLRSHHDPESSIFGGLVDNSFAMEDSILDSLPSSVTDLDAHISELFPHPDSSVSSDDESFDFLGFINDDHSAPPALDFVA